MTSARFVGIAWPGRQGRRGESGLTLVELLVAMTLSTLIALAAVAALIVSRRGFTSVDAASQIRDNARFASTMMQRVTAQAGFLDWQYAMVTRLPQAKGDLLNPPPYISGFDNSLIATANDGNPLTTAANGSRAGACASNGGCSDILVVRYQAQSVPGTTTSDNTMIDCSGAPVTLQPLSRDDQGISVFFVRDYRGEPTLMCITGIQTNVAGVATFDWGPTRAPTAVPAVPVVQGVDNFQVLYGVDGVEPGLATTEVADTVPNRYLRADQMIVTGDSVATNNNWRRVRSVRIGLVLRGPVGSQQDLSAQTLFPFGLAPEVAKTIGGTPGYLLSTDDGAASPDRGTRYTPLNDARLRQTATFTVYLHNNQSLCNDANETDCLTK